MPCFIIGQTLPLNPNGLSQIAHRGTGLWRKRLSQTTPKPTTLIAHLLTVIGLPSELFADGFQFPPAFRGGLGICHLKFIKRIQDNLGNNQPGIVLIIGGNGIPGCMMGAGRIEASLISLHVILPVFPLVNVREAEFPVLLRLINALEKALSLFVL